MLSRSEKLAAFALGLATLSGTIEPVRAASWTPPGVTMGVPLGAAFAPGLYVSNISHYGDGPDKNITADVAAFTWSTGRQFLGASYSSVLILEGLEIHNKVGPAVYRSGLFSPLLIPASLSWNLGQGFFFSLGEGIYFPFDSDVAVTTPRQTSGWAAETRAAVSYINDGWTITANTIFGATTADAVDRRQPNYFNVDWSVAHSFGKWQLGVVGYGAWDLETTETNAAIGPGHIAGVGGLIGYDLGGPKILLEATRAFDQGGASNYSRNDTHVWARVTFPIWKPEVEQSASLK
ncbi:MAG: transporter [Hyphomicrobium sp.]